jgi:aspartate/methionine/tyrosine aminotransferase
MFSDRLPSDLAPNALSLRTEDRRRAGRSILDLTESNPTRAGFPAPPELFGFLGNPESAHYSPDPLGLMTAREAVGRDYAGRGAPVRPGNIVLTASSSESYSLLFKLLGDPGDEMLVPIPSYPLFELLARLENVRVRSYPLRFDHEWHLSLDTLRALVGERTRAVVVVHPNNPTGSFLTRGESEALIELCAERGIAIIADEVFADFALSDEATNRHPTFALDAPALAFALGGLSKSCGLPQLKLGWIAVSGPDELRKEALARLEFMADTYLSVGTPVQLALPWILERKNALQAPIRRRLSRNLAALRTAIATQPELSLLVPSGGWSAVIQCPASRTDEERALTALDAGVLVHPGHFFDFESGCYLVVSLLCLPEVLDAALPALMGAAAR